MEKILLMYLMEKQLLLLLKHNNSVPLFLYLARLDPHAGTYENTLQAPQEDIKKFQSIKD